MMLYLDCGIPLKRWMMEPIRALLILPIMLALLSGCDTWSEDMADAFNMNTPKPAEAASWLFHPDPERRRRGIGLIANSYFGGEEAYLKVYREAATDTDPMVRAASAHALGLHGGPEDGPRLAALMDDSSPMVRLEAARALRRVHHPEAVEGLMTALGSDEDADVRAVSADALGQYAEPRVAEALIIGLSDRSLAVNKKCRKSLMTLTGQDLGLDPDAWLAWYRDAATPFAMQTAYQYPVYTRNLTWFEKVVPVGVPEFEKPGTPRGFGEPTPSDSPIPGTDEGTGGDVSTTPGITELDGSG